MLGHPRRCRASSPCLVQWRLDPRRHLQLLVLEHRSPMLVLLVHPGRPLVASATAAAVGVAVPSHSMVVLHPVLLAAPPLVVLTVCTHPSRTHGPARCRCGPTDVHHRRQPSLLFLSTAFWAGTPTGPATLHHHRSTSKGELHPHRRRSRGPRRPIRCPGRRPGIPHMEAPGTQTPWRSPLTP